MRIGVDIDETISNMLATILPLYNEKYGDNLIYDFIEQYDLKSLIKPECKHIFGEFATSNLILNLDVADGAVDALTYLSKCHEIYFVTAGHPYTIAARDDWLAKFFPFYRSSNLIVCREKQMLNLDVLIDDYENNLIGGMYRKILISKPWNLHVATSLFGIDRISSWDEVPKLIENMERRAV